jgi:tetratricopeptide (TPR) repeat protein
VALQDLAKFEDAAADCTRARDIKSDAEWPYVVSSWLAAAQGRFDDALNWNAEAIRHEPEDASLYTSRADYFLAVGLPARGLDRADSIRRSPADAASINARWAGSAYVTGGTAALAIQLRARPVALAPTDTDSLLAAAYYELLLGRNAAAADDVRRAEAAADYDVQGLVDPWYLRWGDSGALTVAIAAKKVGDEAKAQQSLKSILDAVDRLIAQGVERNGVYELRAGVLALQGKTQQALGDLRHAAKLGWRRSFWAQHEPQFESLWPHADFRAFIAEVDASNAPVRRAVAATP